MDSKRIKHFRIIEQLGTGGMGEVFLAVDETLERKVAIKSIRKEIIDEESKARFLREARILSQLNHPNICTVYDFIEEERESFLILEYVEGKTLKNVIKEKLNFSQKLNVALQICDVLLKAHEKNIVHRDLKPENIMLTQEGKVKVLDFGLAGIVQKSDYKETYNNKYDSKDLKTEQETIIIKEQREDDELTTVGTIMGTISYMSPEQARGEFVSTSSDIYSFGLLLQELFTEEDVYPKANNFKEQLEWAQKGKTIKPNLKDKDLQNLIERMKSYFSSQRPTIYDVYEKLKWIYEKPKRRFTRKIVVLSFFVLITLLLIITYQSFRVKEEAKRANREAFLSQKVSEFLINIFKVSDPYQNKGETVSARELLDKGATKIETELISEPQLRSKIMKTIGEVYMNLGIVSKAKHYLQNSLKLTEESYGINSREYAESLETLGDLYSYEGDLDKAKNMYEESIGIKEKLFGKDSFELAIPLSNLSWVYYEEKELEKALNLSLRAYEIVKDSKEEEKIAYVMNILAMIYKAKGDFKKAEETYLKIIDMLRKKSNYDSPEIAQVMNNLAVLYKDSKEYEIAKDYYEKALKILEKTIGENHIDIVVTINNLAQLERIQKNYKKAEELFHRGIGILEKEFPQGNIQLAICYFNLGNLLQEEKNYKDSKKYFNKAFTLFKKYLGEEHEYTKECKRRIIELS